MSKPDTWELKASSTDSPARPRSRDPSLMPTEFTTIVDRRVSKPGPSVDLSIFNSPAPSTGASSSRPAADRPPSGHHSRDSSRASSSSHAPAGGVHVLPSASGLAPSSASRTSRPPSSGSPSPHPVPDSFRADATWTPSITASVPRESASRSRPAETMPSLPPYAKSAAMSRTSSAHGSASSSASAPDTDSKSSDKVDVREAVEKRRSEIAAVLKVIRLSEKVDLCFMLDCTGSMGPWIDAVKRTIDEVVDRVKGSFPNLAFRLAFVRYTDFDMGAQRTSMLDFTSIVDDFKRFLGTIKADGGRDAPEDVMGGLEAAIRLKWNQGGTHILIHIADCPAHGRQYQSRDMGDDYPEGRGMSHQEAMKALADINVMYNFGYINRGNTDKMVQVFDEELKRITNDRLGVSQFDATRPDQLQFELIGTVTQSITQSLTTASRAAVGVGKEERSVARNFVKSDQAPNWDNPADYAEMPVVVIRYGLPSTIEETCDPEFSLAEKRVTETIKICKWAFAVGGVRVAFRAQNAKHKVELVVKMGKTLGRGANSKKGYLLDMETQSIAQKFLVEFNEEMKKAGVVQLPVKFVLAKVMQVKGSETPFYAAMEPFIEQGNPFLKFNSNAGFRLEDPAYEFLQAFSHWSWKRSRGYTLVCDLQGFVLPDKIMLTDPAIHSKNLLRGSKTNLGVPGMELFFKTHVCGPTCAALGLKQDDFASRKTA